MLLLSQVFVGALKYIDVSGICNFERTDFMSIKETVITTIKIERQG